MRLGEYNATLLSQAVPRIQEELVTELRHMPEGWWALAAAGSAVAVCWTVFALYRREGRVGASMRVRMALGAVRCLVLLALFTVLLEPVLVRVLRKWVDSYTLVLVDDSASMDLADVYRDAAQGARVRSVMGEDRSAGFRRAAVAERLLHGGNRQFLRGLASNNRVRIYSFGSEPTLHATLRSARERREVDGVAEAGSPALTAVNETDIPLTATGPTTNVDRALRRAVESLGGAPLAGVVVLSDGGFNDGPPASEAARFARERRIPIYTVGIGDPSPPRNLRVAEIDAPENVFQKDPFAITARLAAEGLDGETVNVRLRERSEIEGGEGAVVDSRTVTVVAGGGIPALTFERRQERVGRFTYSVEAVPVASESVTDDNVRQTSVNVMDARLRVLVVSGGPGWDYRYLTTLLQRDETVDVSCWLQSADLNAVRDGNTIIDHLPRLAEEILAYDVIVLMDPDRAEFDESWARVIDRFVTEHGGGVLVAAARARTPAFLREPMFKPLVDLLPVALDPEADLVLNQIGHYQLRGAPLEIPDASFGHPVMRLADDPVSTKLLWQGIGDVYWHYPVLREKPVATVLMRHGDPRMRNSYGAHVLAAVQFVGAGRTGFLAFDTTYRWRRHGEILFNRFWVQLVRYLAEGKLLGGTRQVMLQIENDQVSLGEAVSVTARLLNERFEPIQRDEATATFQIEGERQEFTLGARRDRPGWFEGRFVPDRTGAYRVSVRLPGLDARGDGEVSREVRVSRPNVEVLRPQMDRGELIALAEGSAGGRYFELDEMSELAALIPDLHEEVPIRSRPTTLWDNGWTLLGLVGLLSLEWFLRKWNRLL